MGKQLARWLLAATGWRLEGSGAIPRRCVIVAAPHTSNWDLLLMLAFGWCAGVHPRFMMKHTVFVGPAGALFRRLGGIPIVRHRRGGLVEQMVEAFAEPGQLHLLVPPEGTRALVPVWKSGFYQIALRARVPLVLSYLDWSRRRGGFGPEWVPTGDLRRDMDRVRAFYADKVGRHPELSGPIRLAEEAEEAVAAGLGEVREARAVSG